MRISLFHLPSFFPQLHDSEYEFYQNMLLETDKAEEYGFHSVWFAEHHFYHYGGHIPSVPVLGTAVAQRTTHIRIGSGIALLDRASVFLPGQVPHGHRSASPAQAGPEAAARVCGVYLHPGVF